MDRQFFIASAQAMERSMYCIARSYLRCEADCEDALQNALLRAWEKRNTLREERYFRTYLTLCYPFETRLFANNEFGGVVDHGCVTFKVKIR